MRWLPAKVALIGAALLCGIATPAAATAQDEVSLSPRDLNVWGRFGKGTWKRVRVVTDTLDEYGEVTATTATETITRLEKVDSRGLTLHIDTAIDVGGKRFNIQPQTVRYGYLGDSASELSEVTALGTAHLPVDDRAVRCQLRQIKAVNGDRTQVTRLYLSDEVEPFVLRRETMLIGDDGQPREDESTTTVVHALDMPYKVLRETKTAAFEQTTQKTPRGTVITWDFTCVDVPGGIVARTSKELDKQENVVRRSTLELVDYHIVVDEDDDGTTFLTRRQARKARRR